MSHVLAITGPVFVVIGLGYAAVRAGFFTQADSRVLGRFVINFALPALLFKALTERPLAEVLDFTYLLAYALGSLAALATGIAIARFGRRKSLDLATLHGMGMSLSNSGFIGYPIVLQLLGPPAAVALALTMLVENLLMLPIGLALAESSARRDERPRAMVLGTLARLGRNPLILAILAASAFALAGIRLPAPLGRAVDMLAQASAAVALFVIGATLVGLRIKGMLGDVAQIVAGKLLLHPLAVFAACRFLPVADPTLRTAAITFACMPMMSIYPIIAQKYGHEGVCAAALMAATLAAFFSVSTVIWLLQAAA